MIGSGAPRGDRMALRASQVVHWNPYTRAVWQKAMGALMIGSGAARGDRMVFRASKVVHWNPFTRADWQKAMGP